MTFTKTVEVYIDIEGLIEQFELTIDSTDEEISIAVRDYVAGLDDCDYCLIDLKDEDDIFEEVKRILRED